MHSNYILTSVVTSVPNSTLVLAGRAYNTDLASIKDMSGVETCLKPLADILQVQDIQLVI